MGKFIFFITFHLFTQQSFAVSWDVLRNSVIEHENAKDYRVDGNADGKTDAWTVEVPGISVTNTMTGSSNRISILQQKDGVTTRIVSEEKNGVAKVISVENFDNSVSPVKQSSNLVLDKQKTECGVNSFSNISEFASQLNAQVQVKNAGNVWDKSCINNSEFNEIKVDILDAFSDVISLDDKGSNPLITCLEKSINSENRAETDMLILRVRELSEQFRKGNVNQGYFQCEVASEDRIDGKIGKGVTFGLSKQLNFSPLSKLTNSFRAAVLASFGVKADAAVQITNSCSLGDYLRVGGALSPIGAVKVCETCKTPEQMENSSSHVARAMADNKIAGINKKLAETKVNIPSAEETSPMALAAIERTQGPEAAQRVARAQSSSLMGAANTVLGAVSSPAVASSRSLASDTSSSTKRESIKFGDSVVGKRAPASNLKARGIASDEQIVEEIDLTKRSQSASTAARSANANKSRLPASAGANGSNVEATALSNEGGQELGTTGSGAAGAATGGGSRGSLLSDSSSSAGQQGQARSASRAGGATTNVAGREEVVSYFRNADYTQARKKLRDPNFIKILKDNSITVMDLAGNSFGAQRGSTIFLDQGDRFVRQKINAKKSP